MLSSKGFQCTAAGLALAKVRLEHEEDEIIFYFAV
jgi:hypothetical protein